MKITLSALLVLSVLVFMMPATADVAELEPLGILTALGGAERETGQPTSHGVGRAGGRGTFNALGVLPFAWSGFGLQGTAQYVGGQGSRFGASVGPLYDFGGGKTGLFFSYQHRSLRDGDFFWISPALALYFDQANVNLSYIQPISPWQTKTKCGDECSGRREDTKAVDIGINRLQGTVSWFPPVDLGFLRKDNLELTFGVQVNAFTGAHFVRGAGVGPVFGVAAMPWQNLEVTLFKATIDNRSRYQVNSGVSFFFARAAQSLKEFRRKYMEAGPGPVGGFTRPRSDD
jgi:hypothetical protein